MSRPLYFGAGPAHLPDEVLLDIKKDLLNWKGTGLSILETGHRSKLFLNRMEELEALLRQLLMIPPSHHVLFMGLPTRAHFGLIPLHFISEGQQGGYWLTGHWSALAYQEAVKLKSVFPIAQASSRGTMEMPTAESLPQKPAYCYYTSNETIEGIRFTPPYDLLSAPLIADMTSSLLTEIIPIQKYAMILAGTQKNFGIAGLSLVIIEDAFLNEVKSTSIPTYLDYRTYAKEHSICVTPPTFNCEVSFKMLKWMETQGGLPVLAQQNIEKAKRLYAYVDSTDFYQNQIDKDVRSRVNVTFQLHDRMLESAFFAEAKAAGLLGLEGHRLQGGVRVGLYNSVSLDAVSVLIDFMKGFESRYG